MEEEERQMIVLALSRLAVERPGWSLPIEEIVAKLHAGEMFQTLKRTYIPMDPTDRERVSRWIQQVYREGGPEAPAALG